MTRFAFTLLATALLMPAMADAGSFTGASGHQTSGSVTVVQTDAGWEVRLGDDFRFDGAPDPRVGFGSAGRFAPGTDFEPLRANAGAQAYRVPVGIDPAAHNEVYIWCRKYSVPLGVAKID